MYKTFTSIYLTTGSRVKTANEIISIFKIKDGGGLLWSKLSAEIIPHSYMAVLTRRRKSVTILIIEYSEHFLVRKLCK